MDPEKTLEEMRGLRALIDKPNTPWWGKAAHHMRHTELARAMDDWMSRGGFAPRAWQPKPAEETKADGDTTT